MLNLHLGDALTLLFGVLPWATLVPILWQLLQSLGDLATLLWVTSYHTDELGTGNKFWFHFRQDVDPLL